MTDLIHRHRQARPDALALWTWSQQWTYAELDAVVMAMQARLREHGVGPRTRVAVHLPRGSTAITLLWALWRLGAVAAPVSRRLPAAEVGRRVRQIGGQFLIASEPEVRQSSPDDLAVLSPDGVVGAEGGRETSDASWLDRSRDWAATITFTSGTTGTPKAVLHTWRNHLYSAKGSNANIPVQSGDRWLLSLPLYHVGGLAILVRCALAGAAVAVPPPEAELAEGVVESRATHVSLVATQFRRVLAATRGGPPPALRAVLLGGGPIPDRLLRRGDAQGWPLHASYGCTEMASQVTTTTPGAPLDELQTAGRPVPHRRVRIDDGQILVKGPSLFRGYVTGDGLRDPRTDAGWYPTGDRGRLDASGQLHLRGRIDRMFVSGGENVQPEEIEAALEQLDDVERAVVVPVPDAEYGKRPVAFVHLRGTLNTHSLREALRKVLPRFKIPDAFHSLPEDLSTDTRTIDRTRLRKRAHKLRHETADGGNES